MKKILSFVLLILFLVVLVLLTSWACWPDDSPNWTGFGDREIKVGINPSKTLWDWLDLLLIPLIIAVAGWYFSKTEKKSEKAREKEKNQQSIRENYLKTITSLLLEHNLKESKRGDEIRSVAKAYTTTFLINADNARKGIILQFLFESNLISEKPVIDLLGVNLSNSNFDKLKLINIEITGANFKNCNFRKSNLERSIFCTSDFSGSNLSYSNLKNVDFTYCDMIGTKIIGVDLRETNIDGVDFSKAILKESIISLKQYNDLKNSNFKIKPKIV